ncbi:MAG: AzlC family ABC transporter permease [Clostridia bacterium]|nr:AzlC family ABC transporter permease [Clostridia bacterium]
MNTENKTLFRKGLKDGIPTALGYLSVSFAFGITAVKAGLSPLVAVLISLTNLTSAGQLAGVPVIASCGSLVGLALAQLTINIRYFLMSISLSQKLDKSFTMPHRLITAFGVTDENFGVAVSQEGRLKPVYIYGLILLPFLGWTFGTLLGAVAGEILPESVIDALGIAIYGMFVAIVLPPAKREKGVLVASLIAIAISLSLAYVPLLSLIPSEYAIIIAAVSAAAVAAILFPVKETEDNQ